MIVKGYVSKTNLPRLIDEDTKWAFPYIYVNKAELEKFHQADEIVEVTVEIIPTKVHL